MRSVRLVLAQFRSEALLAPARLNTGIAVMILMYAAKILAEVSKELESLRIGFRIIEFAINLLVSQVLQIERIGLRMTLPLLHFSTTQAIQQKISP